VAFLRWQGPNALLVHNRREGGKVRQQVLVYFGRRRHVPLRVRVDVARRFPDVRVDWQAVEEALRARSGEAPTTDSAIAWAYFTARLMGWKPGKPAPWQQGGVVPGLRAARLWPAFKRALERADLSDAEEAERAVREAWEAARRYETATKYGASVRL
jgi:hypothetical protein